jgi:hypothetical protein
MTDLYFTEDGDFFLDRNTGDLEDTRLHQYRGFIQRVLTRVMSSHGEWAQQPTVGADLTSFLGKRNTAEVGNAIQRRVFSELIQDQLALPADLNVVVLPLDSHSIGIIVELRPPDVLQKVILTFSYNLRDNRIVPRSI